MAERGNEGETNLSTCINRKSTHGCACAMWGHRTPYFTMTKKHANIVSMNIIAHTATQFTANQQCNTTFSVEWLYKNYNWVRLSCLFNDGINNHDSINNYKQNLLVSGYCWLTLCAISFFSVFPFDTYFLTPHATCIATYENSCIRSTGIWSNFIA